MLRNKFDFVSRRYFYNTLWLMAENLVRIGSGFIVIFYLARYLGPEGFGALSYSQNFVSIGAAFATLGIDVVLVREIVAGRIKENTLLGSACVIKFVSASISVFLIYVVTSMFDSSDTEILVLIISISIIFDISNTFDAYFQAKVLSKKSAIIKTFVVVVSSVIKLIFVHFSAGLASFAWLLVVDSAMVAFGYYLIYVRKCQGVDRLIFDKAVALNLLKSGWPLMLVTVSVLAYTKIDQIMIKHLMDSESVGYYSIAVKISMMLSFVPLMIVQSVFPKIISVKVSGSQKEYYNLLELMYKIMMFVSAPIAIIMIVFSDVIVLGLFGSSFEPSGGILRILSVSIVLVSVGSVTTKIMYAEYYEKKYLYRSLIGVLVNVMLNYFFIPVWGGKGAAVSTITTLFILFYIYDLFDRDLRKYWFLKFKFMIPNR